MFIFVCEADGTQLLDCWNAVSAAVGDKAAESITRCANESALPFLRPLMLSRYSEQPRLPGRPIRASAANLHGVLSPLVRCVL